MTFDFPTIAEFFADAPGSETQEYGTGRGNRLAGSEADDMLSGRGGNDRIMGRDGDDHLKGGTGADKLYGGEGHDLIEGGAGSDRAIGGGGNDYIKDMAGSNRIYAGDGDDAVVTGRGRDKILAGDGDDMVMAGQGSDFVNGGDGSDMIWGQSGHDKLRGGDGDDFLFGGSGRDKLVDGAGDDYLSGGTGNDKIRTQFGNDTVDGGAGRDFILSRSDSGEPVIAQDPDRELYYPDNPIEESDDVLSGGTGADTFRFRLDIDATLEIAQKHADAKGVIDWRAVAGENDNLHDHWVNGIGDDVITDFSKAEGDQLVIRGHTVIAVVEHYDLDDDGTMDSTLVTLKSDQGGNGGAHDQDRLGTIRLENALLTDQDVNTNAGVFYGAHQTVDDLIMA